MSFNGTNRILDCLNIQNRMNTLIKKYRNDALTLEELSELKGNINSMENQDLEKLIFDDWQQEEIDTSSVDDERLRKIKEKIDLATDQKPNRFSLLLRWGQIAAAVLLPIFMILSVYLYHENTTLLSNEIVIETGKTERASVTLPDGTTVSLNSESRLVYLPKDYNKKERSIHFGGEGYFKVKHDENIPFFINAHGLQVKVLGTTFNLLVRKTDQTAELALEEGCVSLLSTSTNKHVILNKNQKAILDYSTGNITVLYEEHIKDISAWRRGDMIFRNTPLSQVIRTIEEYYNVRIKIESEDYLDDPFTSTLPVNNLNEVLEVIEHSYHLRAVINGKEIILK